MQSESNLETNFNQYVKNYAFLLDPITDPKAAPKQDNRVYGDWMKSDYVTEQALPKNVFFSLFNLASDPIFGGHSLEIDSLYQLNRLDWKEPGKQRILSILKNRTMNFPVLNFD